MANLTAKQRQANALMGGEGKYPMLFGGSRSGKTFSICRAVATRAWMAPGSRHAIIRFRFNKVKAAIGMDTMPKVLKLCFPDRPAPSIDKQDWVFRFPNGSEVWLLGLDDKDRADKILGMEFVSIYFNECSELSWPSVATALTRLAQKVSWHDGRETRLKAYFDCNPPGAGHWAARIWEQRKDPETMEPISRPEQYPSLQMNPEDNRENLADGYIESLDMLPARLRTRFRDGKWGSDVPGALWRLENIEKWREIDDVPDMVRVVVAVDPSGSGDTDNADNDEIGIIVAGLGIDGIGYVIEDITVKAGPVTWGNLVTTAYDRHMADRVVAEVNFGGAMVKHVIQASRPRTPFTAVTASRGKAVRAEPVSVLAEQGKIRHAGHFAKLEDELCSFSTAGYVGSGSPNRADAYVWAFTELFPSLTKAEPAKPRITHRPSQAGGWMSL